MIQDMASFDPEGARWLGRAHASRIRTSIDNSARRARVLLAPSVYTQQRIVDRYGIDPARVRVAPIGLDSELTALIDAHTEPRQPIPGRVLAVGNVLPRKNLTMLGSALAQLRSQGTDATLRIVGQVGPQGEGICRELTSSLGAAVSFSGYVTLDELVDEYRQAEVLAFPSLHEGFGIPALEAMYAGVPVVASATTGLREVVQDAGILVAPDDVRGWVDALGGVITDRSRSEDLTVRGRKHAGAADWAVSAAVVLSALADAASQSGRFNRPR
jgi:glycosyltransferase involved in cell wall biosynthesis